MKRRGEKADAGKKTKCEKSAGRPEGYVQTNLPISSVDASGLSGAVYLYNYPFFRKYHGIPEFSAHTGLLQVPVGGSG
jgi:hypothetical protein